MSAKETTPLMKQYEELKARHPDDILLFRLGDFYEMFYDDARKAAPVLEVALTQRNGVPMCGIPYHALDRYLGKLLKGGLRVSIAEQLEDPAQAKGIVRRDVQRTLSAGTLLEENLLHEKSNNFLAAVACDPDKTPDAPHGLAAVATLDVSTGQFSLLELDAGKNFSSLGSEMARVNPAEVLLPLGLDLPRGVLNAAPVRFLDAAQTEAFDPAPYLGETAFKLNVRGPALRTVKMILSYVRDMDPSALKNVRPPQWASGSETMTLDRETLENLEILKNSYDGTAARSLLQFLDRTLTPMGGRLLKQWLVRPLTGLEKIKGRLAAVDFLLQDIQKRRNAREILKGCSDLERLIVRVGSGRANPRDLTGLKLSLRKIEALKKIFYPESPAAVDPDADAFTPNPLPDALQNIFAALDPGPDLIALIEKAVADEPPLFLDGGGVIRDGYDGELDETRRAAREGKTWMDALEKKEREATQISNLKVAYTSVFGYYFEVTKSHLAKVPPAWHRKQTLINTERFVNEELKNLERKILGAEEQCLRIEKRLFESVVGAVREKSGAVQRGARALAELDCFLALAETAETQSLARPQMDAASDLAVTEGWHPMVKESLPTGRFVPNDVFLDGKKHQIVILTGPNMSGKSTYLRQVALTVLMAHVGSYVPAKEARIGLTDRIFTRIGSGDRLAQGESTFMVEMQETAKILSHATDRSLIILDEVGRGTSTYDGISIAWAVIEHLARGLPEAAGNGGAEAARPKVLFATHYFELTHLASEIEGVQNMNVQAREWKDTVLFLHKIADGPADRSYGIHVAEMAGLPPSVVQRAKKILIQLEKEHLSVLKSKSKPQQDFWGKLNHD